MNNIKVSGFTFVRNAVRYGYPVKEAILSVLPLCDEFVVLVGNSDDGTKELIGTIKDPRIRIFDSTWDDSLREGGKVLAVETDKAMDLLSPDSDWAFYIQADEVFHEQGMQAVKDAMKQWKDDSRVDGLLFHYRHFYGSFDYVGDSRMWYRNEIRVIRNDRSVRSFRDAQGFRRNGKLMRVKPVYAFIHHYGWVRPPKVMLEKTKSFHKLWHNDDTVNKRVGAASEFDYSQIDSLAIFRGTHPKVMQPRIAEMNWQFDHDPSKKNLSLKGAVLHAIEMITGWRIGEYKNYRVLKK